MLPNFVYNLRVLLALLGLLWAGNIYLVERPDGTVLLTDSPREGVYSLWWDDPGNGATTEVGLPRLDAIANLDTYDAYILAAAQENGIPAELIKAVCVAESRMNPQATSPKGARGLMQLIPATAERMGVADPYDPAQSIAGGSMFLAKQISAFGDYRTALAAYNAGPGNVTRYGGVPPFPETQRYVAQVMKLYEHFRDTRPVRG